MEIKPILFNTEMVKAILDGRKTCTRRIVKPQWEECPACKYVHNEYIYDKMAENVYCARCGYPLEPERRAPYHPGDIMYVRETWMDYAGRTMYRADCDKYRLESLNLAGFSWKPSIHMPKEAARIWLKVTDVRVERLQEISGEDLTKEGIDLFRSNYVRVAFDEFKNIWNSTIKKSDLDRCGWDANPWIWVIEFERCEKPQEASNDN